MMTFFRKPVIIFIKEKLGRSHSVAAASALPSSSYMTQKAAKSTCSVPDIKLPKKYRRVKITQDEVDYINGGGIISPSGSSASEQFLSKSKTKVFGVIELPRGALIDCRTRKKQEVALQILLKVKSK
ncbi:unnamed protein product [Arctia plantaginis]|uniref:Uncharacterized protein n=1 Tax=Arctia plantaginis TaxID=874455 RepID=A0A8S1BRX3_ARCPL|nr:unnamed protein product [Arctia plantaginis]CAB3261557.1 unnamed protein product [Arctia plantaginis]